MDWDYIPRGKSNAYPGEQKSKANYKQKEKLASQMHCLGAVKGGWRQSEIFFQCKHSRNSAPFFRGARVNSAPSLQLSFGGQYRRGRSSSPVTANQLCKSMFVTLIVLEYGLVQTF